MPYLYLARHAKSEWNEKGLWTGFADPHLSEDGFRDALKAGEALRGEKIDLAFIGALSRVRETLGQMRKGMGSPSFLIEETSALNERNYGIYTGKNKWQIKEEVGEEEFQKIRRGWDHPIPEGESLKQVYERVIPYYSEKILPRLREDKNVLIVASGNSLRALVKHLENIPDDGISALEIGMGEIYRYEIGDDGRAKNKEIILKGESDIR